MKKRYCVLALSMLILVALSASVAFAAAVAFKGAPIPGTVCLEHSVTMTNDTNLSPTWQDSPIFTRVAPQTYAVTTLMPDFPVAGATVFCEGFAHVDGSFLVSTLDCTFDGSQIISPYPWWMSLTYHCTLTYKDGKVGLPGYFWSGGYEYVIPTGSAPPLALYGPYAYYGEYTAVSKGACK